jgi:glycosyltransferase involved in cell wall biosynthesis
VRADVKLCHVTDGKYRVLLVCTHPVQYASPTFRRLAERPELDILVAYCSLQGAESGVDPDFNVPVAWDVPLLDGYRWVHVPNKSLTAGLGRFGGLVNPGLWKLVRSGDFDAVVIYGYAYASLWIALAAAKSKRIPIMMSADTVKLRSLGRGWRGWWWKRWVKRRFLRFVYLRLANLILVPSSAARNFQRSAIGIPDTRIVLTHYVVDNDFFNQASKKEGRSTVRRSWNVPDDAMVILYCAKLTPWKRPQDLLRSFGAICTDRSSELPPAYLVFAGDGILNESLRAEAAALGVSEKVRFLGFVNQSALPGVYAASDVLVLPSEFEPWGLVVNEAMVCGVPAIVSDQVGAGADLVIRGETGEVYPMGDVNALAEILSRLLRDPEELSRKGQAARARMESWSIREHVQGMLRAIEIAAAPRGLASSVDGRES